MDSIEFLYVESIVGLKTRLKALYDQLATKLTEEEFLKSEWFSFDGLVWAYCVIWSRVFPITCELSSFCALMF